MTAQQAAMLAAPTILFRIEIESHYTEKLVEDNPYSLTVNSIAKTLRESIVFVKKIHQLSIRCVNSVH